MVPRVKGECGSAERGAMGIVCNIVLCNANVESLLSGSSIFIYTCVYFVSYNLLKYLFEHLIM